jgi:hypothetical protein
MPDLIRYDILAQAALRGLVRDVLADAAKKGLPGDHHFYITFDTRAEGVRVSARLLEQYPEEMTIVLQHQFWDLKVTGETFEVGLSFGGVPERLLVPFEAITGFRDPSVQFALQFETIEGAPQVASNGPPAETTDDKPAKPKAKSRPAARQTSGQATGPASLPAKPEGHARSESKPRIEKTVDGTPDKPGGEVVRLDRFRKK